MIKKWSTIFILLLFVLNFPGFGKNFKKVKAADLKSNTDKAAYYMGVYVGRNVKKNGVDINLDLLFKGIADGLAGQSLLLTEEELTKAMSEFQKLAQEKMRGKQKETAETNKKLGAAFLAKNKKKPGIVTLKSGLQYQVLKEGQGPLPKANSHVKCHYKGMTLDGTVFDSSYARGQPAEFPLQRVIPGWTEAVPLMKVGSRWKLFIPGHLAYGERGAGDKIGPNALLIFEIELLEITQ